MREALQTVKISKDVFSASFSLRNGIIWVHDHTSDHYPDGLDLVDFLWYSWERPPTWPKIPYQPWAWLNLSPEDATAFMFAVYGVPDDNPVRDEIRRRLLKILGLSEQR